MNTPYTTPMSDPEVPTGASHIPSHRKLAVTGSVLLAGPLFGAVGTVIGMIGAFSTLAEGDGSADPSALAGNISVALLTILYGAAFGIVGVILVSLALYRRTNRERWFYKSVIVLSVLWCLLLFPVGLVVGIYLIRIFSSRKNEFYPLTKKVAEQVASSDR